MARRRRQRNVWCGLAVRRCRDPPVSAVGHALLWRPDAIILSIFSTDKKLRPLTRPRATAVVWKNSVLFVSVVVVVPPNGVACTQRRQLKCSGRIRVSADHVVRFHSAGFKRLALGRFSRTDTVDWDLNSGFFAGEWPSTRNGEQRGEGHGASGRSGEEAQPVQRVLFVLVRVSRPCRNHSGRNVTSRTRRPGVGRATSWCRWCPRQRCFRESLTCTKSEISRVLLPLPVPYRVALNA